MIKNLLFALTASLSLCAAVPAMAEKDKTAPAVESAGEVDPVKAELARCATMTHTGKRLACFDALAKSHATPVSPTAGLAVPDNWIVHTATSKVDDKPSIYLMTEALEPVTAISGAQERPTLVFRCQENTTDMFVIWGMPLGEGNLNVTERLDGEKAAIGNWTVSTDRNTAFKPSPIPFMRKLLNRHKLLLQLTPENDNLQTVEFSIEGLERVIEPLQKACGWK